ncbi:MerR family transcriptional regulator [Klugiella xanthotipulae]|uniref:MerR family transcriptional regulator n=1 Tax=Klugiella xanthotipulae TaxID=244735 RepID=UPI0011542E19|nr:MerR family transcriptional regulator [Klugiella xanthotipulae]
MRISELAAASGAPITTLKFYLREGMLQRGRSTSPTRAEYGPEHFDRVKLINALINVRGLPIAKVRKILSIIDAPQGDPVEAMGSAIGALPPYDVAHESADYPHAEAAIKSLGFTFDPNFPATRHLEAALEGLDHAGLEWNKNILSRYRDALIPLAEAELVPMKGMDTQEAVTYAVLGTALYEPVILAIRRLAHRQLVETHVPKIDPETPDVRG